MARFQIDPDYLRRVLGDVLNTPSPTGDTEWAVNFVSDEVDSLGLQPHVTNKGALVVRMDGMRDDRPRAISAHLDTLGAMVSEIKSNGRLKLSAIGGVMWPSVESEGVSIMTASGRQVRGSLVLENGSAHVNKDARSTKRDETTLEVRLDERTASSEETRLLGIEVGDYVYFDAKVEFSNAGFIRSRFLDDKAGVASILAALKALRDVNVVPAQHSTILFSTHEEVGHGGMDGLPANLQEYVVVDMAPIGKGQRGNEFQCSIALKDGGGPYSKRLSDRLRLIAARENISLVPDVYRFYSSDGTAYWRSGGDAQVALIGPGVDNSHSYERTHIDALLDTSLLIAEYLADDH
jgi:putative aminopeptidase FrvX